MGSFSQTKTEQRTTVRDILLGRAEVRLQQKLTLSDSKLITSTSSIMTDQKNPEVWKAVAMQAHFEKIQKLKDKIDGVPNFRRVPGYKVYCCGQPTKEGFVKAIEKVCEKYPKDGPIVWINMRQEPIVYVNSNPVCARPANKIGEYAELGDVTRASVKADEEEFLRVLESRAKDGGKIKVVDVNKKESEMEVKSIET